MREVSQTGDDSIFVSFSPVLIQQYEVVNSIKNWISVEYKSRNPHLFV